MKIDGKTGVFYRQWDAGYSKGVFLLIHGLGGHSARWEGLSDFFLQQNFSLYAIELKGFGETQDLKGHVDSFNTYLEDIRTIRNIISEEHVGKKVFLIGESMGGLIAFLLAIKEQDLFNCLICLSPAFKSKARFNIMDYFRIIFSAIFNPKKQFNMPFDPSMCTRDIDYQKRMEQDPREHCLATAGLLINIAISQSKAKFFANKVKIPVLFLLAGEDMIIDNKVTKNLFNRLQVGDKKLIEYPDMAHGISVDLGKENVFGDILKWVEERI